MAAQSAVMYQPRGIRPGWRANGLSNISRPGVHPSPGTLALNNPRIHRQNRGRLNGHCYPLDVALPYASHLQQPKDSRNHQPMVFGAGLSAGGSQMLSSLLAAASPEQQKYILGDTVYFCFFSSPFLDFRCLVICIPSVICRKCVTSEMNKGQRESSTDH